MIVKIKGEIIAIQPHAVVVECNGMGYEIFISLNTYTAILPLKQVDLLTHLLVREDAQLLYGFLSADEKKMFLHLLNVSGIGANTAMVILSGYAVAEIKTLIVNENVDALKQIKGIGLKTAQRIVLELKDKLQKESPELELNASPLLLKNVQIKQEALQALVMLGVARNTAEKNLNDILKKSQTALSVEDLIRLALKTP